MNGTGTIAEAGPYPYTSPMTATLIGFARCSTDRQDPATQRLALLEVGVAEDRIYTDHGLTGPTRARPGLDQALAAAREGDTLVVPKLDRLARSVPDARAIADQPRERGVKLALGGPSTTRAIRWERCSSIFSPPSPNSKPISSACAPARAWPSSAPRGNCAASSPNCPTDSSGNSAACMPRASIPSAISPNSSPSQDQPSIAHSSGVIPLSVRSCPLPESTRESGFYSKGTMSYISHIRG